MPNTYFRLYIHLVWSTKNRRALLHGELEELVHREIRERLDKNGLVTLAVGSARDHVHTLAGWNGSTAIAEFVGNAKGASSYRWNHDRKPPGAPDLEWQKGYGAVSIERPNLTDVIRYIDHQKRHHRDDDLRPRLERTHPGDR